MTEVGCHFSWSELHVKSAPSSPALSPTKRGARREQECRAAGWPLVDVHNRYNREQRWRQRESVSLLRITTGHRIQVAAKIVATRGWLVANGGSKHVFKTQRWRIPANAGKKSELMKRRRRVLERAIFLPHVAQHSIDFNPT